MRYERNKQHDLFEMTRTTCGIVASRYFHEASRFKSDSLEYLLICEDNFVHSLLFRKKIVMLLLYIYIKLTGTL